MRHYYTADAIRAAEAPLLASLPDGVLMRRAAYGLATAIAAELRARTGALAGRRVCAVVGSGDNGGDALWAATLLRRRGVAATAVLLNPERTHAKALAAFRTAGGRVVPAVPPSADLVIDGVVGISGKGPLREAAAEVFAAVEAAGIPVVAVDIPSGIDVQTGAITGPAVRAALTVTFGGLKPVHALADCGRVELVDIGLDLPATELLGFEAADVKARWPVPGVHDDKYTQGVTGIMAGSATYPGAAILCTGAAVAATSGMKRYAGSAAAEVVSHWPEVVAAPNPHAAGRVQAWVVGPGLGTDEKAFGALTFALGHRSSGGRRRRRTDPVGRPTGPGGRSQGPDGADSARGRVRPWLGADGRRHRPARRGRIGWRPPAGLPTRSAPRCYSREMSR